MSQPMPEAWLLVTMILGSVVIAAAVVVVWAVRSPAVMENPWLASAAGLAVIILAVAFWPLYPILLFLVLPAAVVGALLYLLLRRRAAT